ncbi:LIM domain-containing protein [Melia azedarach]|uniref:LIM domain-containing protein n=1 Tax=Melia azedarach TaxID=155640 RepID=A0ACC1XL04_MELAZ|nr:LIM domain-containing protein [Melia azedarach]
MAFGTQEKCKACDKTVHFIDMVSADGSSYHKTCFKCSHCNGPLVMSSYSSMEGVLYCKPHFEQLFKQTGSFAAKLPAKKQNALTRTPSKFSCKFSGTQDKCTSCQKTVYPLEKVTVEGESFHKSCFRCYHGGCFLTTSSYAALDGILYCKPHFAQLFKEKGCYNHLTKTASQKKKLATASPDQNPEAESKATEEPPKSEANSDEAPKQHQ